MGQQLAVDAAMEFAPSIAAAADEIEQTQRIPGELVKKLCDAGLFQLYLPKQLGGRESDPMTAAAAVEAISRADGSVGWCAMLGAAGSMFTGWLPTEAGRALFRTPGHARIAGSARAEGVAKVVEGGYLVTGHWDFASGISHATFYAGSCQLVDDDGPLLTSAATPATRMMLVPVESLRIEETWNVIGLRGTGSHDVFVEDVFIPTDQALLMAGPSQYESPLYDPRVVKTWIWVANAANSLGIAQGALDALTDLASKRASTMSPVLLRDRSSVQETVGKATAIVRAAPTSLLDATATCWDGAQRDADIAQDEAHLRLAIAHAIHESVRAVDLCFAAAGSNAVYSKNRLERCFRDIHVAAQHVASAPAQLAAGGRVVLGVEHSMGGW